MSGRHAADFQRSIRKTRVIAQRGRRHLAQVILGEAGEAYLRDYPKELSHGRKGKLLEKRRKKAMAARAAYLAELQGPLATPRRAPTRAEAAPAPGDAEPSDADSFADPFALRAGSVAGQALREEAARLPLPWEVAGQRDAEERTAANEAVGAGFETYSEQANAMVDFNTAEGKATDHAEAAQATAAAGADQSLTWYQRLFPFWFDAGDGNDPRNQRADQNLLPYLPKPPRMLVYVGSTDTIDGMLAALSVPAARRRLPIRPLDTVTLRVTKKYHAAGPGKGWQLTIEHNGTPLVLGTLCPDGVCKVEDFLDNVKKSGHMLEGGLKGCYPDRAKMFKEGRAERWRDHVEKKYLSKFRDRTRGTAKEAAGEDAPAE